MNMPSVDVFLKIIFQLCYPNGGNSETKFLCFHCIQILNMKVLNVELY